MALYDSWNLPGGQINSSQIYQIRQNSVNHYLWNYLNVGFLNNPATTSKARSRIKIHSDAQWPEAHEKVEMLVEQVKQVATLTRDGPTESLAPHWTWSTYTDTHYQGSHRIPACKIMSEKKRKISVEASLRPLSEHFWKKVQSYWVIWLSWTKALKICVNPQLFQLFGYWWLI